MHLTLLSRLCRFASHCRHILRAAASFGPENRVAVLLQTAVLTAYIGKTVSGLSEYDNILDVRELFEGRIDLSQNACISADAWRTGGTAQAQRGSADSLIGVDDSNDCPCLRHNGARFLGHADRAGNDLGSRIGLVEATDVVE
jgi:hypothetical protein